jgi:hypothetical protein
MALAPGRYLGESASGDVWLWLKADGSAEFGGAPVQWRIEDDVLLLEGRSAWRLTIVERKGRTCLEGPPFKRICLTAAPLAEAPPPPARQRPSGWTGAWRHVATGGSLTLQLEPDGHYRMQQAATGDPVEDTQGRWHAEAVAEERRGEGHPVCRAQVALGTPGRLPACPPNRLILLPDGGEPLPYRARIAGDTLLVGGGDLPMEIGFKRVTARP